MAPVYGTIERPRRLRLRSYPLPGRYCSITESLRLHSLARKNYSVWKTRTLPSVRPIAICHVKSGFFVGIMERFIKAERARRLVQFQQINARLYACDHQPLRLFVPSGPVREESIVYRKPRSL